MSDILDKSLIRKFMREKTLNYIVLLFFYGSVFTRKRKYLLFQKKKIVKKITRVARDSIFYYRCWLFPHTKHVALKLEEKEEKK